MLAFVLPVEVAAPVATLVSITVAAVMVAQDWRHTHLRSAAWLVFFTVLGIPLGLLLLRSVSEPVVKGLLGVLVTSFAASALRKPTTYELTNDRLAWFFGLSAGVIGRASGMNGPPLVVFGTLRRWSPERFRATLQGYFLPASVIGMIGYWTAGLWTPRVSHHYLLSLPTVLLAIPLGRALNRRLDDEGFRAYVHAGLLASGAALALQAIVTWIAHQPLVR
jgi:uncharacterized protein